MDPATLSLVIFGIEQLIKRAPALAVEFQALFSKANPTAEDWDALRVRVLDRGYNELVPNSLIRDEEPKPVTTNV